MAYNYYGSNSVGAGVQINATSNNSYFIDAGTTIGSLDTLTIYGLNATNVFFTILGNVFANTDAFSLEEDNGAPIYAEFVIGETGSITADHDAIEVNGDTTVVSGRVVVSNDGRITGADDGIYINYIDDFTLTNTGRIESTDTGAGDYAVFGNVNSSDIFNSGLIRAYDGSYAIYMVAPASGTTGGPNTITNTGSIIADIGYRSIYSSRKVDYVTNDGFIQGDIWLHMAESSTYAYADTLINSGSISGDVYTGYGDDMIVSSGLISGDTILGVGNDTFSNSGEIIGDILAGDGDDEINNTGLIEGTIDLGDDNDVLNGETGEIKGPILAGSGNDIIKSGIGDDIVYGDNGDDIIHSGTGDDFLEGGNGRDRMYGGAGNDTAGYENSLSGVRVNLTTHRGRGGEARGDWLFDIENLVGSYFDDILTGNDVSNILEGGNGADTLNGEGAADFLFGGNGDDTLIGGDGDDILNGGLDRDILWGGDGVDIFEFLDVAESGIGSSRDVIKDFEQGVDLIDLAAMGATSFSAGGFTNTAGEVTYKLIGGGTKTVIEYDHDGDGAADFQILMTNGGFTMTADDFVLG